MSQQQNTCPRCRLAVAEERLRIAPFICDNCGYDLSQPELPQAEKSESRILVITAGMLIIGFILASSNVELRWLQTRDFVGLSSMKSLERLAKVCTQLKDQDCVEHALARQAKFDPSRTPRHAEFLMGRSKYKEAAKAMRKYIAGGKADANSQILFARALAESGKMDEASKYFERAIQGQKPATEHIQIYVKYLTRAKRFDQALATILRVRRIRTNALPVEYRVISELRGAATNRYLAGKR